MSLTRSSWRRAALFAALSFSAPLVPAFADVVSDPAPPVGLPDSGYDAPLVALAWSPDGRELLSLDRKGEVRAREVNGGKTRWAQRVDGVRLLRVAREGSFLTGVAPKGGNAGGVRWWRAPTPGAAPVLTREFSLPAPVPDPGAKPGDRTDSELREVKLSPDETALATLEIITTDFGRGGKDKFAAQIRVWNADGTPRFTLEPLVLADRTAPILAWGDGGKSLVVGLPSVAVQRFDATTGALQSEWKPAADAAPKIDAAAQEAEDNQRLERLPPAMQERTRRALESRRANDANAPGFGTLRGISDDGTALLAATRGGLQLWNVVNNTALVLESSTRLPVEEAVFSPDNSLVAVRAGSGFRLWRTDGSALGQVTTRFAESSSLAFSPDNSRLAMGDDAGTARVWSTNAELAKVADVTLGGYFAAWNSIRAGGDLLLSSTARGVARIDETGQPRWFEMTLIEAPAAPDVNTVPNRLGVVGLAVAPDGRTWSESVSYEGFTLRMDEAGVPRGELRGRDADGKILWRVADANRSRTVSLLRFLPDGTLLTGKGGGGGIRARGVEIDESLLGLQAREGLTGTSKPFDIAWGNTVGTRDPGNIEILETSADGTRLLVSSGSGGNGIQVIDMASRQVIVAFSSNTTIDRGAWALSPDGKWLAGTSRRGVGIWDVSAPQAKREVKPLVRLPYETASALRFAPNGSLAIGLTDGRVLLYGAEIGASMKAQWETMTNRAIQSLEFSTDGAVLWSGDERGDLAARDAQNGELQSTLRLLAPRREGEMPGWVRWTRAGKINASP